MCGGREEFKEINSNNAFSLYDLYGHALAKLRTRAPGGHEIDNFGTPFVSQHYYIHSLSDRCVSIVRQLDR